MIPKMRRTDKAMDPSEIPQLLESAEVGRLGVTLPDGRPYVVPVNFVHLDGRVYIHMAKQGAKVDAILTHPDVCFEVDEAGGVTPAAEACELSYAYRSVIGFGRARFIEDEARKIEVLKAFVDKYYPAASRAFPVDTLRRTMILEVSLETVTGKKAPSRQGRNS